MRTKNRVEKIESASVRIVRPNPEAARQYHAIIQLLSAWKGDTEALLTELRNRNRYKRKPEPIDLSNMFDMSAEFVRSVNRVADRLRAMPLVGEWETADEQKVKPRHIKLVK